MTDLEREACDRLSFTANYDLKTSVKLGMRYLGQGWEIPVMFDIEQLVSWDKTLFQARFEEAYRILFNRAIEGLEIEIAGWAVKSTTPPDLRNPVEVPPPGETRQGVPGARLYDTTQNTLLQASSHMRDDFSPGEKVDGPATIVEDETTVIVPAGFECTMQRDGTLVLERGTREV